MWIFDAVIASFHAWTARVLMQFVKTNIIMFRSDFNSPVCLDSSKSCSIEIIFVEEWLVTYRLMIVIYQTSLLYTQLLVEEPGRWFSGLKLQEFGLTIGYKNFMPVKFSKIFVLVQLYISRKSKRLLESVFIYRKLLIYITYLLRQNYSH